MSPAAHVAAMVAALPSGARALLGDVRIVVKESFDDLDYRRGARRYHRGYFWGSAPDLEADGTALPDDVPARGEIVLCLGNIRPVTPERLRIAFFHEVAHALGHSEEEIVHEMGLSF